ncbi:hypothetical protein GCM10023319_75640 [Nocardia iowensis]
MRKRIHLCGHRRGSIDYGRNSEKNRCGVAEIIEEVTGIEAAEVTIEKAFVDDLDIASRSLVEIAV